jgi:hypothetical protein
MAAAMGVVIRRLHAAAAAAAQPPRLTKLALHPPKSVSHILLRFLRVRTARVVW